MTGLKTISMTLEEMRAARERGESQSDFEAIRRNSVAAVEPADDADSPDASAIMRVEIARRRAGRPAGSGAKEQVAIRLDRDILAAFRAAGSGWQTRLNAALQDWLKSHPAG